MTEPQKNPAVRTPFRPPAPGARASPRAREAAAEATRALVAEAESMTPPAVAEVVQSPAPDRRRKWLRHETILPVIAAGLLFGVVQWGAAYVLATLTSPVTITVAALTLTVVIVVLILAGGVFHLLYHWYRPLRRLSGVLQEIAAQRAAINELESIGGAMTPLVEPIRTLLIDWKKRKREIGELNEEMRSRVESRTRGLERELGSLRTQATRDGLTGLFNRRMLDTLLPKLTARAHERKSPMSVLMMDVDYFKNLNDTQGHAAGDEFLKDLARLIKSSIRESDVPFRLGGDEFTVAMPDVDESAALAIADRIGKLVDQMARGTGASPHPRLTIGTAQLRPGETAASVLKRGDADLYSKKHARPKLPGRASSRR